MGKRNRKVEHSHVLYMNVTERSSGGEAESDEEWSHHSDVVLDVQFISVYRNKKDGFFPSYSFEVSEEIYNSDKVFLVIPRYFDGGTFGRTCGYWKVEGAFLTETEALEMSRQIETGTYKKGQFLSWNGYFAGLEGVEVHCFTICNDLQSSKVFYH